MRKNLLIGTFDMILGCLEFIEQKAYILVYDLESMYQLTNASALTGEAIL